MSPSVPSWSEVAAALGGARRAPELKSGVELLAQRLRCHGLGALVRGDAGAVEVIGVNVDPAMVETLAAALVPWAGPRFAPLAEFEPSVQEALRRHQIAWCASALATYPGCPDGRLVALFDLTADEVPEARAELELAAILLATAVHRLTHTETLQHARDCADALIEAVPGAALRVDATGQITVRNRRAEALARELVPGLALAEVWRDLEAPLETHQPWRSVRGGLEVLAEPLTSASGRHCGALVRLAHAPNAEHERAQAAQSARLHALGTVLAHAVHDLRNMITPAVLALDTTQPIDAERHEWMREAMGDALDTIAELHAFSRGTPSAPVLVPLRPIVDKAVAFVGPTLPVTFRLDPVQGDARPAWVCSHELFRAVVNLLFNAREAMPHGGAITVTVREEAQRGPRALTLGQVDTGDWAVVEIRDTGEGMTPSRIARLFTAFETSRYDSGGSGLGLAMVREALQRSHGACQVDSLPGRGTSMQLYFRTRPVER